MTVTQAATTLPAPTPVRTGMVPVPAWPSPRGLENPQRVLRPGTHCRVTFTLPAALSRCASSPADSRPHPVARLVGGIPGTGRGSTGHRRPGRDGRGAPALDPRPALPSSPTLPSGRRGALGEGNWRPSRADFLVHVTPLAVIFQATCRDPLQKPDRCAQVDAPSGHKAGVVPVSQSAVASTPSDRCPLIFRVAISHRSILKLEDGHVTAGKASATDQTPCCPLTAEGVCVGCCSTSGRTDASKSAMTACAALPTVMCSTGPDHGSLPVLSQPSDRATPVSQPPLDAPRCPHCGSLLRLVPTLRPHTRSPP